MSLLPLVLGLAHAGSVAADIPVAPAPRPGLVVAVQDAGGRYPAGPPTGTLEDGEVLRAFTLKDDGVAPDAAAGDRVYTGLVELGARGGLASFSLLDGQGRIAWSDALPIGFQPNPLLRIHLEAGREAVLVETNDEGGATRSADTDAPPQVVGWAGVPWAQPISALAPVDLSLWDARPEAREDDRVEEVRGLLPARLGGPLALLVGLVVGLGLVVQARRAPRLVAAGGLGPAPRAPGLPEVRGQRRAWVVDGDPATRLVRLVGLLSASGPVLVVPDPGRRAALGAASLPHAAALPRDRPDLPEVRRAAAALSALGRVVVVVDGPGALEAPRPGEAPDAVVRDLLGALGPDVDAVALLDADSGAEGLPAAL